jgi:DNA-binding LacI/PurR family transcriptional regulator
MTQTDEPRPLGPDRRDRLVALLGQRGRLRVVDLARELGVTAMTVRRDLAALEAAGSIIRVHGGAALAPTPASAPKRDHRGQFAMLVPGLDFYWPEVARGAEAAAKRLGLRLSLRRGSYESPDERPFLRQLVETEDVLGLLVAPNMAGPHTADALTWLATCGLPWLLVEREADCGPHNRPVESVTSDHAWGARQAVSYLWDLGHRRIGFITTETSPTTVKLRSGWEQARRDLGLRDGCFTMTITDHRQPAFGALAETVAARVAETKATALFIHSDREAMGLMQHLEAHGASIPGDLSLVAYDDEIAALASPPLTAVRPARRALGEAAVKLLWSRIDDPDRPVHRLVISPELSIRESTAPPPG